MRKTNLFTAKTLVLALASLLGSREGRAQAMACVSAATTQADTVAVPGSRSIPVLRMEVTTAGAATPLSVTALSLDTKGTTRAKDITGATVYYTGNNATFSPARPFGSVKKAKGAFTVTGAQQLAEGVNYFWLAYDVAAGAAPGGVLDGAFTALALGHQEYRPVWADEFDGDSVNTANWKFEKGFVRNNELQWYQPENATCKDGVLTIEARRERRPNPAYVPGSGDWRRSRAFIDYTAASMNTAGRQEWQYGRFELRAKIDTQAGCWPAWWTLGVKGQWPSNGEIDMMEFYKGDVLANYAVGTRRAYNAHWYSTKTPVASLGDPQWADRFHSWRMDWDSLGIAIYLDDRLLNYQPQSNLYNRDGSESFPFRQKHYMLLNFALGGDNGGDPSGTAFPRKYVVDYVRVAQKIEGRFTPAGKKTPLVPAPLGAVKIGKPY
ncbi:family 16 glycosylhydrolase [Paraflavisolibacter sp. H34]|uniref:BNR-repeat neuraminidase N-terminal domain-containing protein n=1 Tax=Huijunlia imazamoxiresistens TaxID=3127457 RepID=UPI0030192599